MSSGNVAPFYSNAAGGGVTPATQGNPQGNFVDVYNDQTAAGYKQWIVAAQTGVAENVARFGVSDNASGLVISNANNFDGAWATLLTATTNNALTSFGVVASGATDTGSFGLFTSNAKLSTGSNIVVVRPLYDWQNNGTSMLQLLPLNSGAQAGLLFSAGGGGAPAFTTRNAGERIILLSAIGASTVDHHIGVASGTASYWAIPAATSSYEFDIYAGITKTVTFRGDGLLDNTGTVRATGQTAPSSGVGVESAWNGSLGYIQAYDRGAGAFKPMVVAGTTVTLQGGSTNILVGDTTKVTFGGGQVVKTRTALTSPVTVATTDYIVASNLSTAGAVSMVLPTAASCAGQYFATKDEKGDAGTNNITITVTGGGTIDGATSKTINTPYGNLKVYSNGVGFFTI